MTGSLAILTGLHGGPLCAWGVSRNLWVSASREEPKAGRPVARRRLSVSVLPRDHPLSQVTVAGNGLLQVLKLLIVASLSLVWHHLPRQEGLQVIQVTTPPGPRLLLPLLLVSCSRLFLFFLLVLVAFLAAFVVFLRFKKEGGVGRLIYIKEHW